MDIQIGIIMNTMIDFVSIEDNDEEERVRM